MSVNQAVLRGRYKIIREISRGGMGAVYLAGDLLKNREVAVKKSFFSGALRAARGFEIEAKLLARLEHAGLPKVLDYFLLENNVQALVMDFIAGETLEEILESGKFRVGCGLDAAKVTDWAIQILDILRYLHNFEPPIVHRDIKPNNIKLTAAGKIVLLDFGLAKGSALTVVGGTSGYSPIEQVDHSGTDPRSDVYALGATLFHLLTDRHPDTALNRFRAIHGGSSVSNPEIDETASPNPDPQMTVAEINSRVPAEISVVVTKATALLADDRFQTAGEMQSALRQARQTLAAMPSANKNAARFTNVDALNDWEKAKPLFDENEESLGHWQPQENTEDENDEDGNDENSGSFASQNSQKIAPSDFDFAEQSGKKEDDLSATVSASQLFGNGAESAVTRASFAVSVPPSSKVTEILIPNEIPAIEENHPPPKINRRIVPLILSGGALILFVSLGILAWHLIASDAPRTIPSETQTVVATSAPASAVEAKDLIEISTFRAEKNGGKTLLPEDHLFENDEQFFFNLKFPAAGFLYIVSRNSRDQVVRLFPLSETEKNAVRENAEIRFPQHAKLYFDRETPEISWIYFLVVPSREHELAEKLKNALTAGREENLSKPETASLIKTLDETAESPAKNDALVKILKTRKKP